MASLANPVIDIQKEIARNLYGGLSSLGDIPLEKAKMGLEAKGLEYNIGRQKELDELNRPVLEYQKEIALRNLGEAKKPFRLTTLIPHEYSLHHALNAGFLPKIEKLVGGTFDKNPDSPTHNLLISNKTGQPMSQGEVAQYGKDIGAILYANTGLDHSIRQMQEKLKRGFERGEIDTAVMQQTYAQLEELKKPENQIPILEKQRDNLLRFESSNPLVNWEVAENVKRLDNSIAERKTIVTKAKEAKAKHNRDIELRKLEKEPKEGDVLEYFDGYTNIYEVYKNGKWNKYTSKMEYDKLQAVKEAKAKEKEIRTSDQKEFDRFIENNPEYKGKIDILEWKSLVDQAETDPLQAATKIAQSNMRVQMNPEKMGDVVNGIMKIWAKRRPELWGYVIYNTPEEVIEDIKNKNVTQKEAESILQQRFGFE